VILARAEGDNPLCLPQAKIYAGSCALGVVLSTGTGIVPGLDFTLEAVD
jgi:fumarylacetoacetate (FAA) hydrolase family protein